MAKQKSTPSEDFLLEDFEQLDDVWSFSLEDSFLKMESSPGVTDLALKITYRSKNTTWGVMKGGVYAHNADWSGYVGVRADIKGTVKGTIFLCLVEQGSDNPNADGETRVVTLRPSEEWQTVTLPFAKFKSDKDFGPRNLKSNNLLDLNRVKDIRIIGSGEGTLLMDNLYLLTELPPQ